MSKKKDDDVDQSNELSSEQGTETKANSAVVDSSSSESKADKDSPGKKEYDPADYPPPDPGFYGDFPPGMGPPAGAGMSFGPPQPSALPDDREKELSAKTELTQEELFEWLTPVEDPELFMSVVELGLVYKFTLEGKKGLIEMTLTSPGCPAGDYIVGSMKQRAEMHPLVEEAEVKLVWEPKWDPYEMASEDAKDALGIW